MSKTPAPVNKDHARATLGVLAFLGDAQAQAQELRNIVLWGLEQLAIHGNRNPLQAVGEAVARIARKASPGKREQALMTGAQAMGLNLPLSGKVRVASVRAGTMPADDGTAQALESLADAFFLGVSSVLTAKKEKAEPTDAQALAQAEKLAEKLAALPETLLTRVLLGNAGAALLGALDRHRAAVAALGMAASVDAVAQAITQAQHAGKMVADGPDVGGQVLDDETADIAARMAASIAQAPAPLSAADAGPLPVLETA